MLPTDLVQIKYAVAEKTDLANVAQKYKTMIESVVKSTFSENAPKNWVEIITESFDIQDTEIKIGIFSEKQTSNLPAIPWINLVKDDRLENRYVDGSFGTVLIQTLNRSFITVSVLKKEVEKIFGLYEQTFVLRDDKENVILENQNTKELSGKVVFVSKDATSPVKIDGLNGSVPFVEFHNSDKTTTLLENPKGVKLFKS